MLNAILLFPAMTLATLKAFLVAVIIAGGCCAILSKIPINETIKQIALLVVIILFAVWAINFILT